MPVDSSDYASRLYGTLHQLDDEQFDWIAIENPDDTLEWEAVLDRLKGRPDQMAILDDARDRATVEPLITPPR